MLEGLRRGLGDHDLWWHLKVGEWIVAQRAVPWTDPFAANGTDDNGRAAIEWGVYGVPETFVIGRDGRIAYKLIGPVTPDNLDTALKPAIEQALANP